MALIKGKDFTYNTTRLVGVEIEKRNQGLYGLFGVISGDSPEYSNRAETILAPRGQVDRYKKQIEDSWYSVEGDVIIGEPRQLNHHERRHEWGDPIIHSGQYDDPMFFFEVYKIDRYNTIRVYHNKTDNAEQVFEDFSLYGWYESSYSEGVRLKEDTFFLERLACN